MDFDEFLGNIDSYRNGSIVHLPYNMPKIERYVKQVRRGKTYLVGGESGSGKTTFANHMFVYSPLEYLSKNPNHPAKVKIIYFSMELTLEEQIGKIVCRFIYLKYQIIIDPETILSPQIDETLYRYVLESRAYVQYILSFVDFRCGPINPTGIYKAVKEVMEPAGTWMTYDDGKKRWFPSDPNQFVEVIVDHLGLLKSETSADGSRLSGQKQIIDKYVEYQVECTMKYGVNFIPIQQLNRSLASAERMMSVKNSNNVNYDKIRPSQMDYKESGNPMEAAHVSITLFSPNRYEIETYRDFKVSRMRDRFRMAHITKNRFGKADIMIPMVFIGESSLFMEMGKASEVTELDYRNIEQLKLYEPKRGSTE